MSFLAMQGNSNENLAIWNAFASTRDFGATGYGSLVVVDARSLADAGTNAGFLAANRWRTWRVFTEVSNPGSAAFGATVFTFQDGSPPDPSGIALVEAVVVDGLVFDFGGTDVGGWQIVS